MTTDTTTLHITGMTCGGCAGRAERALAAVPGVTSASVNLASHSATVRGGTPAAMAEALQAAGYPAATETLTLDVAGMSCASCMARVEKALQAVPGVLSAAVNFANGTARVEVLQGAVPGRDLAAAVATAGYKATPRGAAAAAAPAERQGAEAAALRRDLILAAALTLPVFVLEMGSHLIPAFHHWVMATLGQQTSWVLQFLLTTAVLAGPGRVFHRLGWPSLWRGAPDMNALVALGTTAAWGFSTVATFWPGLLPDGARAVYFEAAAVIVTLILLGRWLEARAKGRTGAAIARLVGLGAKTARVRRDGGVQELAVEAIEPGDLIELRPGEKVAVDGEIVEGSSWIDESMLTGEPLPAARQPGDAITGGTVNGTGALVYRATRVGRDTVLARIIAMVEAAQGARLPIQDLVNRVTLWFVPAVIAVAVLTVAGWLIWGPSPALGHALVAGVAVLIIACPCAMGLATPTSIMVGTGRAADLGVLFRQGDALQGLEAVRVVAFDKTGTLTEGRPVLTDILPVDGMEEDALLALAAAAEAASEHPLGRAVVLAAERQGLSLPPVSAVEAIPGHGLRATQDGAVLLIGSARLMRREGIDTVALDAPLAALAQRGRTPLLVARDGRLAGALAVSDPVRAEAAAALSGLRDEGVVLAMITGDSRATAEAIAAELGIAHVVAEVLPDGKVDALDRLRAAHGPVAFVGDGLNDAPALAAADIGIAIGTGTDVAIESADVVLMSGDPRGVATAIALSRATLRNIRQNLAWAFGYNILLIPVAAGLLYPFGGPLLSPMLAAGAMSLSSVFVLTNALRLRRAGAELPAPRPAAPPAGATVPRPAA